jgi:hypothetical protein
MYPTLTRYAGPKNANMRFDMAAPEGIDTVRWTSERETPTFVIELPDLEVVDSKYQTTEETDA